MWYVVPVRSPSHVLPILWIWATGTNHERARFQAQTGMRKERRAKQGPRGHNFFHRLAADVDFLSYSGIFGYVNYLVEKDRKFIIDTLINGT